MLTYIAIFVAKLIEVCLATIRVVLINRGEKLKGSFIAFFEIIIWVYVVSAVLTDIAEDPIKVLLYALAFTLGNYLGVTIENKIAIGTASIQILVKEQDKAMLMDLLRDKGFGVTVVKGEGKTGPVDLIIIYLKRKRVPEVIELIDGVVDNPMIVVNDVRQLKHGYITNK